MNVTEQLKQMSDDRFHAMYESLVQNGFGPLDAEVAQSLKFRPQAIRKLPLAQRAKRARSILGRNPELTYEFFGGYLMQNHKKLVTDFLDGTSVPHEEGMIEDLSAGLPDAGKLGETIDKLDQDFPPEDVTLYLSMCSDQWSNVGELEELWRGRLG
jgi:hypothetical protein